MCKFIYRSTKGIDKGSFVAVCTSGEAPIRLFPFGWKARLDRSKVEEATCGGDRGGRDVQVLNRQEQEELMEWENVRIPMEDVSVEQKTDFSRVGCALVQGNESVAVHPCWFGEFWREQVRVG